MSERHRAAAAAYLILRREDKILLGKRCNTGWYDGWYAMPAGKIEVDEVPTQALIRECEEEIGIRLESTDITFALSMYRETDGRDAWADYFFVVQDDDGTYQPYNAEPEKCDELEWFSLDKLPDNLIPNNRRAIEAYLAGQPYVETAGSVLRLEAIERDQISL